MSKTVTICGLYLPDYDMYSGMDDFALAHSGEIWTVNDWYLFMTWLKPSQIWNIHRAPYVHPDAGRRFTGDWKARYNKAVRDGAEIVSLERMEGIEGQRLLNTELLLKECEEYRLGCSISMMICQAALDGFRRINVIGVRFKEAEYLYQIQTTLFAILFARSKGCSVEVFQNGRESEMLWRNMNKPLQTIIPYWLRK